MKRFVLVLSSMAIIVALLAASAMAAPPSLFQTECKDAGNFLKIQSATAKNWGQLQRIVPQSGFTGKDCQRNITPNPGHP